VQYELSYNNQHNALFIFSLLSITLLHVLGVSAAHCHEVECVYVANGTGYTAEWTVSGPDLLTVNSAV
jgi:hypothetical protein